MRRHLSIAAGLILLTAAKPAAAQNIGIGTTSPTDQLHTTGTVRFQNYGGIGTRLLYVDSAGRLALPPTGTLFTSPGQVAIPDNGCGTNNGAVSSITVSGAPTSIAPLKIAVRLNITHPADGELAIFLLAPNGALLTLARFNGGAGANFTSTIFTSEIPTAITSGSAPFNKRFKPQGSLTATCLITPTVATFTAIGGTVNINPNGVWTLKVFDNAAGNTGTLDSWQITFEGQGAYGTTGATGPVPYFNNGNLALSNITNGASGNVGVGTTNPLTILHVEDAAGAQTYPFYINSASTTGSYMLMNTTAAPKSEEGILMSRSSTTKAGVYIDSADVLNIGTYGNSTYNFTMNQAGNIAMGTYTPQQMLSVNAAMNVEQADTSTGLRPDITFGSGSGEGIGSARAAGSANQTGLDLYTAFNKRLSITNNGRVGIGNTNPLYGFQVEDVLSNGYPVFINSNSAVGSLVQINDYSSTAPQIGVGYYRNGASKAISVIDANNNFVIGLAGIGNYFTLTPAGNLGLGQGTPGFPLNFASTLGDKISLYGNSGASYGFGVQTNLLQIHTDVATADVAIGAGSSGTFTENARFKGNGKVGIGTNNPGGKLQVNATGNYNISEGNGHALELWDASASPNNVLYMGADATNSLSYIQAVAVGGFRPLLLQGRGGNVGVGVIAPAEKLEVSGNEKLTGNVIVQTNKGIIRNNSATQLKQVVTGALLTGSPLAAGGSLTATLVFSETFSAAPTVYIGNIITLTSGNPEKIMLTVKNVTASQCDIAIYNPGNAAVSFNAVWNVIAIGAQ